MSESKLRYVAWTLHKWFGLTLGVILTVIAISGLFLLFADDIDQFANPQRVASGLDHIPLDAQIAASALRIEDIALIELPRERGDLTVLMQQDGAGFERFYVDPGTGELLDRSIDRQDPAEFIYFLHSHLLLGEPGHIVAGISALAGIGMLITGVMLWWPRRGAWAAAFSLPKGPAMRFWRELHKLVGVVAVLPLSVQLLTGASLVFFLPVVAAVSFSSGTPYRHFDGISQWQGEAFEVQLLLDQARAVFPQATPTLLELPQGPGGVFHLRLRHASEPHPNGRTFVTLDPLTRDVLFSDNATQTSSTTAFMNAIYPLHIGATGGVLHKIASVLTGIALAMLMPTGAWFWWLRRQRKVQASSRLSLN